MIGFAFMTTGSSPLARGLLVALEVALTIRGIIPARAGFTQGGLRYQPPVRDHPRSRGVYGQDREARCASQGVMSQDIGDSSVSGHR